MRRVPARRAQREPRPPQHSSSFGVSTPAPTHPTSKPTERLPGPLRPPRAQVPAAQPRTRALGRLGTPPHLRRTAPPTLGCTRASPGPEGRAECGRRPGPRPARRRLPLLPRHTGRCRARGGPRALPARGWGAQVRLISASSLLGPGWRGCSRAPPAGTDVGALFSRNAKISLGHQTVHKTHLKAQVCPFVPRLVPKRA